MDSTGRMAIPFDYEWACAFKNGLAWVQKKDRYGFIDKSGKTVIPFKYGSAYDYVFMEAHGAPVLDPVTGERFFVDRNGKEYRKKP
ncbi:MAG: WG repeat-containing protein [Bacteroidetes bacterium]|nr:WG repeat-containing protein [Bacteroidota bacterium]